MKKSLIALAVVAAAGTSFAQSSVNLTGAANYGYGSETKAASGTKTKGFGVDTSEIALKVTEDLGGGLKLSAQMGMEGFARNFAPNGLDHKISLSGSFGTIYGGAIKIGSGIRGLAQAGAPVNNMEGEILPKARLSDIVGYVSPNMSGFSLSASLTENTDVPEFSAGMESGKVTAVTVGGAYSAGPIGIKLDTTAWRNTTLASPDKRVRLSGGYDLGVVKLGAGYEDTKAVNGSNTKIAMLGVSAPVGSALTVGAVVIKKDAAGVKDTGYSVGASYALSKRTSIDTNYSKWSENDAPVKGNKFKLLLSHSF